MPAKTTELHKLAETHMLPFIHIYPSANNTVENSTIFDALTKSMGAKKVVAVVRFPQIGPNAGMVMIYHEKNFNLIGLLFLKVPIPNLTVSTIPPTIQQQQLQQMQLQQHQQAQQLAQAQAQAQAQQQAGVGSPNLMSPVSQAGVLNPQQNQQQSFLMQAQMLQQQKARFLQQQQQQQLAYQQQQAQQQQPQNGQRKYPFCPLLLVG